MDERARTVLSCFSGAGGLDLGLETVGFEPVGCVEIDVHAQEVLRLNRPAWTLLEPSDVVAAGSSLRPHALGLEPRELDLIAGGPPCQPFSKAAQWALGTSRGMSDTRGQAVLSMLDLVESFLPAAMLIENVAGFLEGPLSAEAVISERLKKINSAHGTQYELRYFKVNASDYGVAQHRERVLATAFRDGHVLTSPPQTTHAGRHLRAGDALADVKVTDPPAAAGKWAQLLPLIPEGKNYQHLTSHGDGPEIFGYRTRYWSFLLKLARDRPAWTLPASPGPSTGPFHWNNRPLAAAERLALQGFPIDWKLSGDDRDLVRLTGNATPPPLAEAAARQILGVLQPGNPFPEGVSNLAKSRVARLQAATKLATEVPAAFLDQVGQKDAHPGPGAGPAHTRSAGAK